MNNYYFSVTVKPWSKTAASTFTFLFAIFVNTENKEDIVVTKIPLASL